MTSVRFSHNNGSGDTRTTIRPHTWTVSTMGTEVFHLAKIWWIREVQVLLSSVKVIKYPEGYC